MPLPVDVENIIYDYHRQLIVSEKYKKVLDEINKRELRIMSPDLSVHLFNTRRVEYILVGSCLWMYIYENGKIADIESIRIMIERNKPLDPYKKVTIYTYSEMYARML